MPYCCCCFCLTVLSRKLRLRVVIDFLLFNSSWSKSCWNKIKNNFATLLSYAHPAHTFQTSKWQTEDHQNLTKDTVNLKLNGSRSNHWNLIQRCSNDSLWTKPCGILVFTIMSSTYCIAWTLLLTPDGKYRDIYVIQNHKNSPSHFGGLVVHRQKKPPNLGRMGCVC